MTFKPTMKILYGPPGTGKTWLAAREAVRAIDASAYGQWISGALTDEQFLKLHHQYVQSGRIKWVTFHPSYSYEDFVEGFRPILNSIGKTVSFELRKGPFREICEVAAGNPGSFGPPVGSEIPAIGGTKTYDVIAANDYGWFLRVRPNRTDQVGEEQEKFVTRSVIERAAALGMEPKVFSIPGKGEVKPSDYGLPGSDTIGGSELRRIVGELLRVSSSDLANSAHFGAVAHFIKESGSSLKEETPACLVIDEINRADISRVFGELITLLEPDKRIGAAEERRIHLPYSNEDSFGVPATLSVIGTMNSTDRSISSMDFAMRRRFVFEEITPNSKLCPSDYGGAKLDVALAGINRRVAVLRGRDFCLGHSTFMKAALEDVRATFSWPGDNTGLLRSVAYVLRTRVIPLLAEYFHEDWRKIEVALAVRDKTFTSPPQGLFTKRTLDSADLDQFRDLFDAEEAVLGEPAAWWDPHSVTFDHVAFSKAMDSMG